MLQLQLYIEGEQIELYDDESITLTQSIQDVRDIKKIFYDYSRTFSVPASKNNKKIFKTLYSDVKKNKHDIKIKIPPEKGILSPWFKKNL